MMARTEILQRLRAQRREVSVPHPWQSRQRFDDLGQQFAAALTAVYGKVYLAASLEEASGQLGQLLAELGARRVVANDEPPLSTLNLAARWPDLTWHIVGQTPGDLRAFAATADVGLSSAAAAIAETGSLLIASGPGRSRLVTLLPPVHVVLLPARLLTTDLFTFMAARGGEMPANVTFVSGPSKTADIEQTMSIGVHGPKQLSVILYQE